MTINKILFSLFSMAKYLKIKLILLNLLYLNSKTHQINQNLQKILKRMQLKSPNY
jgi:hypothetical protein